MRKQNEIFSLAELYLSYRKAKAEAFHETTHFHALAFTKYEAALDDNLKALHEVLNTSPAAWANASFVGGYLYAPKSIEELPATDGLAPPLIAIDPHEDWHNRFAGGGGKRAKADFRLVVVPTVDFQIVSALWILRIGHVLDAKLLDRHAYANRVRRVYSATADGIRDINRDCLGIFPPYFSAYRAWRETGLRAMRQSLEGGGRIFAITMDIRRFYHNVSPQFLARRSFLQGLDVNLSQADEEFNKSFIAALEAWYRATPDFKVRPDGGLPVGLSASKVISNVLMHEFDSAVSSKLTPIYYGRYVDDVFLVLPKPEGARSGDDFLRWIAKRLKPLVRYEAAANTEGSALQVKLPYASDCELTFSGAKQKIFDLSGEYGLDLVSHISEQIRNHSSEYRLLPKLPEDEVEMASRSLLATPNASLEADALRKADVVSVRRLGFSLLLRDVETYARELRPRVWRDLRVRFYRMVGRHLLTPKGFFDYFGYIHRVFAVMVGCGDFREAESFLASFRRVVATLLKTTTSGSRDQKKFSLCLSYYAVAFVQSALQASTVDRFQDWVDLGRLVKRIRSISEDVSAPTAAKRLRQLSHRILHADWGRRPYKDFWLYSQKRDAWVPSVPVDRAVRSVIRLAKIRRFRFVAELRVPFWPALAFPTRPVSVTEIGLIAPDVYKNPILLQQCIMGLRGARVPAGGMGFVLPPRENGSEEAVHFVVPESSRRRCRIAVTSVETNDSQWEKAVQRRPDLSAARYQRLHQLINRILEEVPRVKYISLPECSVPLQWALPIASKLAQNGVSLLAGVEYRYDRRRRRLRNDCLVSLTTRWPGYPTNIVRLQSKLKPAHKERSELDRLGAASLFEPLPSRSNLPVYVHGDFFFGALLCSDLTNMSNRRYFQGGVDALFVLEWNRDIGTFDYLVESTAHDLHAFIVQINNRMYGDSRIRAPYRDVNARDVVRVKGGISDYYVVAVVEYRNLRKFQLLADTELSGKFKPLPIGFRMSDRRRKAT